MLQLSSPLALIAGNRDLSVHNTQISLLTEYNSRRPSEKVNISSASQAIDLRLMSQIILIPHLLDCYIAQGD